MKQGLIILDCFLELNSFDYDQSTNEVIGGPGGQVVRPNLHTELSEENFYFDKLDKLYNSTSAEV